MAVTSVTATARLRRRQRLWCDGASDSIPLSALLRSRQPRETRVLLPTNASGEAQVAKDLYESVRAKDGCLWGALPRDLLRLGKGADAGERFVHAKVYRFFQQKPKREYLFIGSANLTNAAHQRGGNLETGFLVEVECPSAPEFWLRPLENRPKAFEAVTEDSDSGPDAALPLRIS